MLHQQPLSSAATIEIVRWTARLGAVTADALAARHETTTSRARARLLAAQRQGLVAYVRPLHDQPALYTATRAGLREAGTSSLGICAVSASNALHLITCASVAVALESRHLDHRVEGERELRRAEHDQRRALASARIGLRPDGEIRLHRPDLVLWPRVPSAGLPVAVEIEIWPSGTRFAAGEQIRLLVQATDVQQYPPGVVSMAHSVTRNVGSHVIHTGGKYDSHLLVPVVPPA